MSLTLRIVRFQMRDALRSRWLVAYALFFLLAAEMLLRFGGGGQAVVSLVNVVLIIVPLVSLVFGTVYLHGAREFTELLLAQPVRRRTLFAGLYLGLALSLCLALVIGLGVPFLVHSGETMDERRALVALVAVGVALTLVFTAVAYVLAVKWDDRVRGFAAAIGIWLLLAVPYDGAVLFAAMAFAEYPIERPLLGLMLANPVDLGRIVLLLQLDVGALLGYTGAVFNQFFGSIGGVMLSAGALAAWIAAPVMYGLRSFARKDF